MAKGGATPLEPESEGSSSDAFDSAADLIEAAERKKAEAEPAPTPADGGKPPSTRKRRKKKDESVAVDAPPPGDPEPVRKGPSAWTAACACAALTLVVLTIAAVVNRPDPLPVDNVSVDWMPGPQVSQREVLGWISTFPQARQLPEANAWLLDKLREHLLAQPAVAEVRRVQLVHAPAPGGKRLGRIISIQMGLRRPYMPAVMATGARVWIDEEGYVLPGNLPGPGTRRPLIRGLEQGSTSLRPAVEMWRKLEPQIEAGLVSDIHLCDVLDQRGDRGIVLSTRGGSRLVWGRPEEERFGRDTDTKVRDLVHTIRCQGDLSRVATINVRFAKPFFTLR